MQRSETEKTKGLPFLPQLLFERRAEIEPEIGEALSWERLDDKNAARVALYHAGPLGAARDPSVIPWATDAVAKMLQAFREPVRIVLDIMRNDSGYEPQEKA